MPKRPDDHKKSRVRREKSYHDSSEESWSDEEEEHDTDPSWESQVHYN